MNEYEIIERVREILTKLQGWPEAGDRIVFKGQSVCRFTNQIENAAKLSVGSTYTISKIEVYSSSSAIWLEGFEGQFSLGMFGYQERVPENKEELEKELIDLRNMQWYLHQIVKVCEYMRNKDYFHKNMTYIEVEASLNEIAVECSEEDWNGEGAKSVSKESVETTLAFCALLEEKELPEFAPCPWGGIGMGWYMSKENMFDVIVLDNSELIYAWTKDKKSQSGALVFDGVSIPNEIREILDELELK